VVAGQRSHPQCLTGAALRAQLHCNMRALQHACHQDALLDRIGLAASSCFALALLAQSGSMIRAMKVVLQKLCGGSQRLIGYPTIRVCDQLSQVCAMPRWDDPSISPSPLAPDPPGPGTSRHSLAPALPRVRPHLLAVREDAAAAPEQAQPDRRMAN